MRGSKLPRKTIAKPVAKTDDPIGRRCPVVVMGASAGGFESFAKFFQLMPPDTGLSFLIVQHLDPSHDTLMPELLAKYERFVFLPMVLEPFGRTVVEAWAAGCAVVTNGLVGARYWIERDDGAIESAASDFWELVLADG